MRTTDNGEASSTMYHALLTYWFSISLMRMSEIEREDILTQRLEEMQRIQDKRNLDQMLKAQSGRGEESVSKAAKRVYFHGRSESP